MANIDPWQKANEYQKTLRGIQNCGPFSLNFAICGSPWRTGNSFLRPLNWTPRLKPYAISTTSGFPIGKKRRGFL
jgi:hypothetical protein